MEGIESEIYQVLVKLLDGKHKILNFTTPSISIPNLKDRIETLTAIPSHLQFLISSKSRILHDHETLDLTGPDETLFPGKAIGLQNSEYGIRSAGKFPAVVNLLLRLRGGKGGFGSLLRGAATKAGQKKTNNFDACRDMSGRRLRHVNAEKKLDEWRAEAEERKLEKMAEEFIKKKAKEMVKKGKNGGADTDKYVAKYREDSAKCMEEVERSVRESLKGLVSSKRKGKLGGNDSDSKRLKIWMGKRKLGDSDNEDMDDSDDDREEENEKSIVTNGGTHSDSSKEAEGSSGSVTGGKRGVEAFDKVSSESGSEEEKDVAADERQTVASSSDGCSTDKESEGVDEKNSGGSMVPNRDTCDAVEVENEISKTSSSGEDEGTVTQLSRISCSRDEDASAPEANNNIPTEPIQEESVSGSAQLPELEKPLNIDEFNSASDLEVLGMDRLKSELQAHGLKCGGTLQERAARLFLIKTTPLEKLPKKLFAKK